MLQQGDIVKLIKGDKPFDLSIDLEDGGGAYQLSDVDLTAHGGETLDRHWAIRRMDIKLTFMRGSGMFVSGFTVIARMTEEEGSAIMEALSNVKHWRAVDQFHTVGR